DGNFNRTTYAVALVGSPARTAICAPGGSIGGARPQFASFRFTRTGGFLALTKRPTENRMTPSPITQTIIFLNPPCCQWQLHAHIGVIACTPAKLEGSARIEIVRIAGYLQ